MKVLVIGGTGFAGSFVAKEANRRGHDVVVLSRSAPKEKVEGIRYVQGSALDPGLRKRLLNAADAVVAAVSPRGDMAGKTAQLYADLANEAVEQQVRLVVIGGFSSLRPALGQPRFVESSGVPKEYEPEIKEMVSVLDHLKTDGPKDLRWVFISPAANFGANLTVADHGQPRQSGEVALFDENGESQISGSDFAIGVVDEIEKNEHDRENISFAQGPYIMKPQAAVERFFTAYYSGDAAATRDTITEDFSLLGPFVTVHNADEFFELAQGLMQIVRGHKVQRWVIEGNNVAAFYQIMIQGPAGQSPLTMAGWFVVNDDGRLTNGQLLYDRKAFDAIISPS